MNKLIGEGRYLAAWFVFWLVSLIGGAVAGGVIGFIVGIVLASSGIDMKNLQLAASVLGFLVSIPVSYVCFRLVVGGMIVQRIEANMLDHVDRPMGVGWQADAPRSQF